MKKFVLLSPRPPGCRWRRSATSRCSGSTNHFADTRGAEQFVDISERRQHASDRRRLIAKGVVRDEITYRLALWSSGDARRLQAGEYGSITR